jgi:hypothetical protein
VHSADLQIDGLRRLVVLTPDLAEHEGEEDREHDAELQKDNGTDLVVMTAKVDPNTAVDEGGCERSDDGSYQYDRDGGGVAHRRSRRRRR